MIFYEHLNYKLTPKIGFDLDINNDITVIKGDSATGKTLLVEGLKNAIETKVDFEINPHYPIKIFDKYRSPSRNELSVSNNLIVIDNFDDYIYDRKTLLDLNLHDNQYILISRSRYLFLKLDAWCIASIRYMNDNYFRLHYNADQIRRRFTDVVCYN